jgi:hypothetical protein
LIIQLSNKKGGRFGCGVVAGILPAEDDGAIVKVRDVEAAPEDVLKPCLGYPVDKLSLFPVLLGSATTEKEPGTEWVWLFKGACSTVKVCSRKPAERPRVDAPAIVTRPAAPDPISSKPKTALPIRLGKLKFKPEPPYT